MFFRKKPMIEALLPPAPPPGMPPAATGIPVPLPPPVHTGGPVSMQELPPMFGQVAPTEAVEAPESQPAAPSAEPVSKPTRVSSEQIGPIPLPAIDAEQVVAPKHTAASEATLDAIKKKLDEISVEEVEQPSRAQQSAPDESNPSFELENVLEQFQAELMEVHETQNWLAKQEAVLEKALSATEIALSSRSKPFGSEFKTLHNRYDAIEKRLDGNEKSIKEILLYLHRLDNHLKAKKVAKRSR